MMTMARAAAAAAASILLLSGVAAFATQDQAEVSDEVIASQRSMLAEATEDAGFGP